MPFNFQVWEITRGEEQSLNQMRIIVLGCLLASLLSSALAQTDESEFCAIPQLEPGVATSIEVPYIDKPFCGMALIGKRYVQMTEFAKAVEESETQCASDSFCTRVLRFFRDSEKATDPYILIFHGPRHEKKT